MNGAEADYRRILAREPANPDALHLLGTIIAGRGALDEGAALIRRAVSLNPVFPEAFSNLGNIQLQAGDPGAAESSYRTALAHDPNGAKVHHNLAVALRDLGRLPEALAAARQASELNRGDPLVWLLLAGLLETAGQATEAEPAYRRACALAPRLADARTGLGNLLFKLGRKEEAEAAHRLAVQNDPSSVTALYNLGAVLRARGDPAEAAAMLRRALAIDPLHADAWNALGASLRGSGRFDEAAECFRKALALRPDMASAWRHLTLTGRNVVGEADRAALEALSRRNLPRADAASVRFALAKLLDEQDQPDEAFLRYREANALVAATFSNTPNAYDRAGFERMLETLRQQRPWEASEAAESSERPVLIVGMPRSGTSLVEQILASHPAVFAAGELPDLRRLIGSMSLADAGVRYEARLADLSGGAARVTDKMPDNIFELGRVAAMLPSARVILCRRDARDTGVSCFMTHFAAGNAFAYDLGHCGHRIRHTEALAEDWRNTLKLRMTTIDYEALVDDLEGQSRRLVAFLGLAWDPACLDFHRTERPVTTASAWQVRQPLFRDSVGRWKRYAPHLTELLEAL